MDGDRTRTMKPAAGTPRPGRTVAGKYRLLREIGRGGMGVVYEAEDLRLKRRIALKFLPPDAVADADARARFLFEARAASGLDHPNICVVHEIGETRPGAPFIAMALCPGESLKARLARGPLPAGEAADVARQVADGLAAAHGHGIVHRDVKPGNLVLARGGPVKILDFGLAKLAGSAGRTAPGTAIGTPGYMSPEQVRGDPVDARTDVWSLGVVLYEMLTGELPFGGGTGPAVFHAVLHEPPREPSPGRPAVPPGLDAIVRKALDKAPERRFASAAEMADALRAFEATLETGRSPSTARRRARRSRKPLAVSAAAATLALVAVAVWLLERPGLAFERRDKVMVADAQNMAGDPVFDVALRTAIEAALQQSPFAVVFDRGQIADTLRLMRADPASRVDEALAVDVCRFAGVKAFVQPRILAAGAAFELEAVLVDPARRRHVDRVRVAARGREDVLLHGIDALARRVRSKLGESVKSIEAAARPIATVTTSSWEALNYFSRAQAKRTEGKNKEAVALFELALAQDPKFVAARGSMALLLVQFLDRGDEGRAMLKQALRDALEQKLPDRDLLPLKAVNKHFVDRDLEGALAEYRTAMDLFPDLMPPANNAGRVLEALGRFDEAAAMYEEGARRAPRDSTSLTNLWFLRMNRLKDPAAAEAVARRLVALSPGSPGGRSFLGYTLAVREKFADAEAELRKALAVEPDHAYAMPNLAHVLFAAGKPAEAVPYYERMLVLVKERRLTGTPEWDAVALALALRGAGRPREAALVANDARDALRKTLGPKPPSAGQWLALAAHAELAGDRPRAESCLTRALAGGRPKDPDTLMDLAEVYALLGRTAPAVAAVRDAMAAGYSDPFFPVILPELQILRGDPAFRAIFRLPAR